MICCCQQHLHVANSNSDSLLATVISCFKQGNSTQQQIAVGNSDLLLVFTNSDRLFVTENAWSTLQTAICCWAQRIAVANSCFDLLLQTAICCFEQAFRYLYNMRKTIKNSDPLLVTAICCLFMCELCNSDILFATAICCY